MKQIYSLILSLGLCTGVLAQTVSITANPGTSPNIVVGPSNYHVSESIYTNDEIGAGNFITPGSAIQQISFFLNTVGAPSAVNNFKVSMKNIPLATTTLATGAYSTAGYTTVYNGSIDVGLTGLVTITLSTPFVRTANTNLEVLIERTDNIVHTGNAFDASVGNIANSAALSSRRYNNTTAPASGVTSLTATSFRPAIQFVHTFPIDAELYAILLPDVTCYDEPQTISVAVYNAGTTTIAAGAATVNLSVSAPNSYSSLATNANSIAPGSFDLIDFSNINLGATGAYDVTSFVTLAGDGTTYNDTLVTQGTTATTITTYPATEDVETTLPVFAYANLLVGDQLWTIQTGDYTNPDQTTPLSPRAPGTSFFLFDAYSGAGSAGFESRLYSNCLSLPAYNNINLSFWMSHDNIFPTNVDSLSVSISTDHGATWTRFPAGYLRYDATGATPFWRQENIDLTAYAGQTVQIGFEGYSDYGNAFGLDDIVITATPRPFDAELTELTIPKATCNTTPQSVSVKLYNRGTNNIAAGAATVRLTVAAPNAYTTTLANSGVLTPGNFTTLTFNNVNINNTGLFPITTYVTLAGDNTRTNDTLRQNGITVPTNTGYSFLEDAEGNTNPPLIGYQTNIYGDLNAWAIQTGDFTYLGGLPTTNNILSPRAPGTKFFLYDGFNNQVNGTRMISNCISIPSSLLAATAQLTFWMSHDTSYSVLLGGLRDSLYLSVSNDKGVTWTRLAGYGRYDAAFSTPGWRQETVNLTAYAGQTVQLGFEGISGWGNFFGVDDIALLVTAPVSLLNFDAQRTGSVNQLTWKTSQETNSSRFIVERSRDGRSFTEIGVVGAAGNSNSERNYRFVDQTPAKGINYYRLRMVDIDAAYKFSEVRNVRNLGVSDISFAPNPVQTSLKLTIESEKAERVNVRISDISGKVVYRNALNVINGTNVLPVNAVEFAPGTYIVEVITSDGNLVSKFIKD
ncbi:MAG TPA: choice-of-anchor J domain-containing protein [Ferruginibacter sp.]|nr:choice-of-anchor J domain-containing protein [Ferruginibacter sp.]